MTTAIESRLVMSGISKRFGATIALDQVDFDVRAGEVHALVGENGAGKSTLMKVLSGAHKPDAGEMHLNGAAYEPRNPLDARKLGVGMIYQELQLAPHLSVAENIVLGIEPRRFGWLDRKETDRVARTALQRLGHEEISVSTLVSTLSSGQQQLVEIARALASGCELLVFDEPTSSLSQHDIERLFGIIDQLRSQGLGVVYISHFLEEVQRVANRITVLRDGKIAGDGRNKDLPPAEIVRLMVGREIQELYPRSPRAVGATALELTGVSGISRPREASLQLRYGEVLGICGLVAAGRSELLRAVFGLEPVQAGEIRVGAYTGAAAPQRRWKQGMGFLSEDRKTEGLALNLAIADNVTLSRLRGFGPGGLVLPKCQSAATEKWVSQLDIRCRDPQQSVAELSGGNQQKTALARLLQHDVDVFLLDEPTRGIDVAAKARIYQVIDALATGSSDKSRPPRAVLMVSSYLPELLGVCDRIAVMYRGALSPALPVDLLDEHKLMLAATGQTELSG